MEFELLGRDSRARRGRLTFARGTVETIGLQRGRIVVVITAYWLVPDRAPPPRRKRQR